MKKILLLFFKLSLVFHISLYAIEDQNSSTQQYYVVDEQVAYNVIKKVFRNYDSETIIDTNWSSLHLSTRTTIGYIDMQVLVNEIVFTTKHLTDTNTKEIRLEIFSTINDKKHPLPADDFLYRLFWNRIDYALGISTDWLECFPSFEGTLYYQHPLCTISKEELQL
ncbi:MAG: hypothetical protein PHR87_13210 [Sulfurospirillaceae bacterium]|nr:hypothetical protein [Sulfurospirillaceae bacterium]